MGQKQQLCEVCYQPRMGLVAKSGQMLDIYIYILYTVIIYIYGSLWISLFCHAQMVWSLEKHHNFGIFWVPTDWNSWLQKLLMLAIYSEFTW